MTLARYDTRDVGSAPEPEARLAELARAAGPLRRAAAAVAGRLVATRGWERLGFARPGDYARERLGLSASSLHEWARVDRRLAALPGLEAALVSGELPWSKVRLLARFATEEDEAVWIAHARVTGVRALERQVRAVDRGALETGGLRLDEDGCARESSERVRIPGSPAMCFTWQRMRRLAEQVAGQRLTPGDILEMVTAETLSALPLDDASHRELESERELELEPGPGDRRPEEPPGRTCEEAAGGAPEADALPDPETPRACTLPPFLRSLVAGLAEADAFELDARLRRVVRLEQGLDAAIGPLLRQVTSPEYEWQGSFQSLAAFAREQLGMSPRKARALVRLERAGDACPELRHAYREGRLSWLQAQILAPLFLRPDVGWRSWREAWVSLAGRVTVRRLEEVVDQGMAMQEQDASAWARVREDPERLARAAEAEAGGPGERQVCVAPMVAGADEEGWGLTITAPTEVARLFRAVLCTVRRAVERETGRLPAEGPAFEAMLHLAFRSWGIDEPWLARRMRRVSPVFQRDGWRCTVPGCSSRRNLHAHHIVFRSAGGSDAPANLTTLCAHHHQRGVHGGTITVRGRAPHALTFELGVRPGLPPLARYHSGDEVGG